MSTSSETNSEKCTKICVYSFWEDYLCICAQFIYEIDIIGFCRFLLLVTDRLILCLVWKIGNAVFSPPNGHLPRQKASSNDCLILIHDQSIEKFCCRSGISMTAFFSLKLTILGQKFVISSIFKQALIADSIKDWYKGDTALFSAVSPCWFIIHYISVIFTVLPYTRRSSSEDVICRK